MTTQHTCKSCGNQFRADRWRSCYSCGEPTGSAIEVESESESDESTESYLLDSAPKIQTDDKPSNSRVSGATTTYPAFDLPQLVRAQNKTTHAVRALAYFFFIQFQTGLAGGTMIWWAIGTPSNYEMFGTLKSWPSFVLLFGFLILLGGMLLSIIMGYRELGKSE